MTTPQPKIAEKCVLASLPAAALLLGRAMARWREEADSAARRDHANRAKLRETGASE